MVNKILLIAFSIVLAITGFSQDKRYYEKSGRSSSKADSHYYRAGTVSAIRRVVPDVMDTVFIDSAKTYFTASGKMRSKEFRDARGLLQNDYVEYFENGYVKEKGTYEKGRPSQHNYGFYSNGTNRYVFFYTAAEADSYNTNRLIFAYWDSLGNQVVKDGQGFCKCDFSSGSEWEIDLEEGQLANGLRIGEWSFYRNEKLVNKELYDSGKFVNGVAYTVDGETPYTAFEEQAEFKGGLQGLGKFLMQNLTYPKAARKRGAEGQSFVSFVIEKDGSVSDVKIVRVLDKDLDVEACRVVKATSGKWSTGRQRGHPVKSRFVLPIRFKL